MGTSGYLFELSLLPVSDIDSKCWEKTRLRGDGAPWSLPVSFQVLPLTPSKGTEHLQLPALLLPWSFAKLASSSPAAPADATEQTLRAGLASETCLQKCPLEKEITQCMHLVKACAPDYDLATLLTLKNTEVSGVAEDSVVKNKLKAACINCTRFGSSLIPARNRSTPCKLCP